MINTIVPTAVSEDARAPGALPVRLELVETETPGVYELTEAPEGDAVLEETEDAGVYEATDTPGAGAKARAVAVGAIGLIIGGA